MGRCGWNLEHSGGSGLERERDMGAAVSEMGIVALGMNETTWGDRSG